MEVRLKIGKNAGQMIDLPFATALDLVLCDQAEDVNGHMRLPPAKVTRVDAVTVQPVDLRKPALEDDEMLHTAIRGEAFGKKKRRH